MSLLAAAMVALILPGIPSLDLRGQMPSPSAAVSVQAATPVTEETDAATAVILPEAETTQETQDAGPQEPEMVSAPSVIAMAEVVPELERGTPELLPTSSAMLVQPTVLAAFRPNPPVEQKPVHKFWDRTNKIGFAVHGVARVADAVQSCILLTRPGRREAWLPTKSCTGIAIYSVSMIPAQIGTSYLMHRKGHHHLERWVPYFWATPTAAGIAVSFKAW